MAEEVMKLVKAALVAALAVATIGTVASPGQAAPLPTNVGAMKAALDTPVVQVRYGRGYGGGGWGRRGWGGYRVGGYRGYGRWGLGAAAVGAAVVGGAIARSGYYGDAYPYYGGGYAQGGDDASDDYASGYYASDNYGSGYCHPSGYGQYYPGYGPRRHYYGW
jgi:hypothetical protein